jgi:hypothetical protein
MTPHDPLGSITPRDRPDFKDLEVVPALPSYFHRPEGGEELFAALTGAQIVRIGSPASAGIEGGGLIIDYLPEGSANVRRAVFGFNELGMWTEDDGPL